MAQGYTFRKFTYGEVLLKLKQLLILTQNQKVHLCFIQNYTKINNQNLLGKTTFYDCESCSHQDLKTNSKECSLQFITSIIPCCAVQKIQII